MNYHTWIYPFIAYYEEATKEQLLTTKIFGGSLSLNGFVIQWIVYFKADADRNTFRLFKGYYTLGYIFYYILDVNNLGHN